MYLKSRSLKLLFSFGRSRRNKEEDEKITSSVTPLPNHMICFSYQEIYSATKRFHPDNLVGRVGYAEVYKGIMEDGCVIAKLNDISLNENENSQPMPWAVRYKIAVGTVRGLHFLHKICPRRIIHRDIKASNILLTANYEPQISDFGLAKWIPLGWNHRAVGPIEGSFGCLAPEYFMHGIVDEKIDVFAFGVFLLEVMSGRKPVDGYHESLLCWAKPRLTDEKITVLVDSRLGDNYEIKQLKRLVLIASLCIRTSASWRPSMAEVLDFFGNDEISHERWKMPEVEAEKELWRFDDLDSDLDEWETPSTCSSMDGLIQGEDQEN